MKPSIYISIVGLAIITQVGARATKAEIPSPVVDNSDVNDNLFDLASQAIITWALQKNKLMGPYGEVLKIRRVTSSVTIANDEILSTSPLGP